MFYKSQSFRKVSDQLNKICILLSSIFSGVSFPIAIMHCFKSQVLCKEGKVSNLNVAFEMVPAAKSSIQWAAPGQRG